LTVSNVTNLTIRNSSVTCPECGNVANFIEGTFNVYGDIIEIVAASPWTRHQLARYQSALEWAAKNYAERPRAAIRRIERVSPETASWIRRMRGPYSRAEIIAVLSFLATIVFGVAQTAAPFVSSDSEPVPITNNQVIQVINETPRPVGLPPERVPPAPQAPSPEAEPPPSTPPEPGEPRGTRAIELPK
jgi:hypothetical protein